MSVHFPVVLTRGPKVCPRVLIYYLDTYLQDCNGYIPDYDVPGRSD